MEEESRGFRTATAKSTATLPQLSPPRQNPPWPSSYGLIYHFSSGGVMLAEFPTNSRVFGGGPL